MTRLVRRLLAAHEGSTIVELGLLAPLMCSLLLGVLQVGLGMHSYNALRGISADVARYAVVQTQSDNPSAATPASLELKAEAVATLPPYGLQGSDFTATVTSAATQRVAGAKEMTMTLEYKVDSLLNVIGIDDFTISFERPIFVLDD